jgi:1,2-diacylglycerol 3-beta-galactosyltransferase
MAGGDGVGVLVDIVTAVAKRMSGAKETQLVVICGNNSDMVNMLLKFINALFNDDCTQISSLSGSNRIWPQGIHVIVHGFVQNVDELMGASDLLVTKAGPGTIAEAMILGLPLVISTFLPGQEEANVPYVVDGGFGLYSGQDPECIADTVHELLLDPARLAEMSRKAKAQSLPGATLAIAKDLSAMCLRKSVSGMSAAADKV